MRDLKKMYEEAREKEREKRIGQGYVITNEITGKKYCEKGGFFLCGFIGLGFRCKGKNFELRKELIKQGYKISDYYYGGKCISFGYENGGYELGLVAISKVIEYLNSFGYNTYSLCIID